MGHHPLHRALLHRPLPRRLPLLFPGKFESLLMDCMNSCLIDGTLTVLVSPLRDRSAVLVFGVFL